MSDADGKLVEGDPGGRCDAEGEKKIMNAVVLNEHNWEPSELAYLERHLGPIVPPNTYNVIVVSRTPGGTRWYAWPRLLGETWSVVARSLEILVERVLSYQKIEE